MICGCMLVFDYHYLKIHWYEMVCLRLTTYSGVDASDSKIISIKIFMYIGILCKINPYLVVGCGGRW